MHRAWIRRLTLPLWAVWLALAVTERPLSLDCPMRAGAASGIASVAPMPPMPGMTTSAKAPTNRPVNANCCGCLGDCGTAPAVLLPAGGDLIAVRFTTPIHRFAALTGQATPVVRADRLLPYPNAPPLSALI